MPAPGIEPQFSGSGDGSGLEECPRPGSNPSYPLPGSPWTDQTSRFHDLITKQLIMRLPLIQISRFSNVSHKTMNTRCRFQLLRTYRMKARIRRKETRFKSQSDKYTVPISTEISDVSNENTGFKKQQKIIGRAKITEHMNNMR